MILIIDANQRTARIARTSVPPAAHGSGTEFRNWVDYWKTSKEGIVHTEIMPIHFDFFGVFIRKDFEKIFFFGILKISF